MFKRLIGFNRVAQPPRIGLIQRRVAAPVARLSTASTTADGWRAHVDWKWLRSNVASLDAAIVARRMQATLTGVPARVAKLHSDWVAADVQLEAAVKEHANASRAAHTGSGGADPTARESLQAAAVASKQRVASLRQRAAALWDELYTEAERLPNGISPHTPIGDESAAKLIATAGTKPAFTSFPMRDHLSLGQSATAQWFNLTPAISGPRFLTLQNEAALLELGLIQFAMSRLVSRFGFTPLLPPDLVKSHYIAAAGFQPRAAEHTQIYQIKNPHTSTNTNTATAATPTDATASAESRTELALTGTSEVPIAAMLSDKVLSVGAGGDLPLKVAAFGHCFRTEIGSGAGQNHGIYRLHQFSKVEMFVATDPASSEACFDELVSIQRSLLDELELHYRVLEMPSAELGAPAFRKVDIEAWMPSRNAFGEVTSASNCTDYQSRRLNIKYQPPAPPAAAAKAGGGKAKKAFVHTLNATACAVPRLILALIEQHQRADGSVHIPTALRPFLLGEPAAMPFLTKRLRSL